MVKGISRQVIVVQSPDKTLFDQAIFILKDNAFRQQGITDEALLKEARALMAAPRKRKLTGYSVFWAAMGALFTGTVWLLTLLL